MALYLTKPARIESSRSCWGIRMLEPRPLERMNKTRCCSTQSSRRRERPFWRASTNRWGPRLNLSVRHLTWMLHAKASKCCPWRKILSVSKRMCRSANSRVEPEHYQVPKVPKEMQGRMHSWREDFKLGLATKQLREALPPQRLEMAVDSAGPRWSLRHLGAQKSGM